MNEMLITAIAGFLVTVLIKGVSVLYQQYKDQERLQQMICATKEQHQRTLRHQFINEIMKQQLQSIVNQPLIQAVPNLHISSSQPVVLPAINCTSCGAQVRSNQMQCAYCGTERQKNENQS